MLVPFFQLLGMEHPACLHIPQNYYRKASCGKPSDCHDPLARKVHLYPVRIGER